MSNQRYSPEFKDEAVRQVVVRGHSVAEVSDRLGVSAHSLYKWVRVRIQCYILGLLRLCMTRY
jgi:transposase